MGSHNFCNYSANSDIVDCLWESIGKTLWQFWHFIREGTLVFDQELENYAELTFDAMLPFRA